MLNCALVRVIEVFWCVRSSRLHCRGADLSAWSKQAWLASISCVLQMVEPHPLFFFFCGFRIVVRCVCWVFRPIGTSILAIIAWCSDFQSIRSALLQYLNKDLFQRTQSSSLLCLPELTVALRCSWYQLLLYCQASETQATLVLCANCVVSN